MTSLGFFGLAWGRDDAAAAARARSLGERLDRDPSWRLAWTCERLSLWTSPTKPITATALPAGRGVILGDAWPMPGADPTFRIEAALAVAVTTGEAARIVSCALWGRFLAILLPPDGGAAALYREPGGAVEGLTWRLEDGLHAIANDLVLAPAGLRPRRQGLNWDRIAIFLGAPSAATTEPLFDDIAAVGPGEMLQLGAAKPRGWAAWDPAAFAVQPVTDLVEARRELVRRVDASVAATTQHGGRFLAELSGGLDSSIVAGCLHATASTSHVACWVNFVDDRGEADERHYAGAVVERLGRALHVEPLVPQALTEADFRELGGYGRPSIGGADAGRDRAECALLKETGAGGIISGQGGDGVFFQFPTALVAADAFQRDGWRTLATPLLADVARRSRRSVWGVLGQVRAARRGRADLPTSLSTVATRGARAFAATAEHAWVRAGRARGLPPAKLLHLHSAAVTHIYRGPSRRLDIADLHLPLFSQPVLELCLAISVPDLAGASYDRPYARTAFADRLPAAVLHRRAKGALGAYFARTVARSLPTLRPYLLDGCLAEAGVIDRTRLDQALDRGQLLRGGPVAPADVLIAAATEAWVRYWQTQVGDSPSAGRWP
jgi:asparagine synthase (glutamine-hydrolysing)